MQGEADHQHHREGDRTGRRRLPDRQSFGQVVQPEPGGDHHRQRFGWSRRRVLYPSEEAAVEIDQAEQADADACREDPDQHEKAAIASTQAGEGGLHRS